MKNDWIKLLLILCPRPFRISRIPKYILALWGYLEIAKSCYLTASFLFSMNVNDCLICFACSCFMIPVFWKSKQRCSFLQSDLKPAKKLMVYFPKTLSFSSLLFQSFVYLYISHLNSFFLKEKERVFVNSNLTWNSVTQQQGQRAAAAGQRCLCHPCVSECLLLLCLPSLGCSISGRLSKANQILCLEAIPRFSATLMCLALVWLRLCCHW